MSKPPRKAPKLRFKGFTEDWEQRKLGEVVEFFSGLTYSPDNMVEEGGTFVLRSSNVKNGEIVDADNVYVNSEVVNSDNVQVGDIIVVVRNGSRNLIGKHAQIKKHLEDTVIGAFMTGVRSETPNFLNAMLDTQQFSIEINKNLGATINQITTGAFKKMMFYIPTKDERDLVGAFFNNLDNLITLHQRKLDKLQLLKKYYLQSMLPMDGESVPKLRFTNFQENWEQRRLGEIVNVNSGQDYKHLSEGDIPVYGTGGYMLSVDDALSFDKDGIGIGRKGTIDKPYLLKAPFWTVDTLFYVIPKEEHVLDFVYLVFQKINWKRFDESTGVPSLSKKTIISVSAKIPKNKEQQKIGPFFKQLDNLITLHKQVLEHIENLKKAHLQNMFI